MPMPKENDYPLHEMLKLKDVECKTVGEFLDFLEEGELVIARWTDDDELTMVHIDKAKLIGQFLGIDANKLEAEKRDMLEKLRG